MIVFTDALLDEDLRLSWMLPGEQKQHLFYQQQIFLHIYVYFLFAFFFWQDVTFVSWSKTGDYLALGTGKGTMCIYHRRTNEKVSGRLPSLRWGFHIL